MLGSFSENSLRAYVSLLEEEVEFSENETYDFTRCVRSDGSAYGTRGKCRKGSEEAKEVEAPAPAKAGKVGGAKVGTTKRLEALSLAQLKQLREDPRLYKYQQQKIDAIIAKKNAEPQTTAAAKNARPVDPKVAAKVDKAMKKKAEGPRYTPEQLAAQDRLLKKMKREKERQTLLEAVKDDAIYLKTNPTYQGETQETLATLRRSYATMKSIMKDPAFQNPENQARMINTRLAIWRQEKALRETQGEKMIDPSTYAKDVKDSPKYSKTPGSTKPIAKAGSEDPVELEKKLEILKKKYDETNVPGEVYDISNEMLNTASRLRNAKNGLPPSSRGLKAIYEEQGYNAKPELVGTASDLRSRKDLITDKNGNNIILYRGVSTAEFADQFKGLGPDGAVHFPGHGIYGNGSYAAAPNASNPKETEQQAIRTAKGYSGNDGNYARQVTAFGLRKDANVVTFPGKEKRERDQAYDAWHDRTLKEAEKKTGYRFSDIGEAAAALGIHAYQVPQRDEDYFVILNRGAIVAAADSQLSDR